MKLQELYKNDITRKVNPAVSASDLDPETVKVEISEYVFTPEIAKNIYKVLANIQRNTTSHNGIWISGYYGSGKSHFLKFVDYCMSPKFHEAALKHFQERALEYDSMDGEVDYMPSDIRDICNWYGNKAQVETIMFNIGSSYNADSDKRRIFTEVLWNEFNAMRGYNKSNIALAQFLEKYLDDRGKFDEFKRRLEEELGQNWDDQASDLAVFELDSVLEIAKEIIPTFTIDAAKEAIMKKNVDVSVNKFADELAAYIKSKSNPNFRLVFFIDEVSQFINGDGNLLLQLQSVVKEIHDRCNDQVWVACTAQQDLREILDDCKINSTTDEFGKILGRFEVQASLQGTKSEYITQQRILAKTHTAQTELARFFDDNSSAINTQFQLPTTYDGFKSKDDFIDYYPFVPYQLQLINRVFSQFVALGFVNKEVKGNERSIIRITHNIAKANRDEELGYFISFDQFFNDMFRASLQPAGVQAQKNAIAAAKKYDKDKDFALRVVNVLFMICNMSEENKRQFPATIDNLVTLLMRDVTTPKQNIKENVARVIEFLKDSSIIREVAPEHGGIARFEFYTEEESEVARLIAGTKVDPNKEAVELWDIFKAAFSPENKEKLGASTFSTGITISSKNYYAPNPDIAVELIIGSAEADPNRFAFSNLANRLVFFATPLFAEDKRLQNLFYHYCQVQMYSMQPTQTEERRKTIQLFVDREKIVYENEIKKRFIALLDSCPIISGNRVLTKVEIGDQLKGNARYKAAMAIHLRSYYNMAHLVDGQQIAKDAASLRTRILRPLNPSEYDLLPMNDAETTVRDYILRQGHDVTVGDITVAFGKAPFGWSEIATIDIINELYRRNIFSYSYSNNPNVGIGEVADKILREKTRFTLEKAQAVSQEVIKAFTEAWNKIFNNRSTLSTDARELFRQCHDSDNSPMRLLIKRYTTISREIAAFPFVKHIEEAVDLMNSWYDIREHSIFFDTVTKAKKEASELLDRCKDIVTFYNEQLPKYRDIVKFIEMNSSNFDMLGDEAKKDVEQLTAMRTDGEVYTHFPDYIRLRKAVQSRIDSKHEELVSTVRQAYETVYEEVRKLAADNNIEPTFLPDLEKRMFIVKNERNLFRLASMPQETGDFFNDMVEEINKVLAKRAAQPTPPTDPSDPEPKKKPVKKLRHVTLKTKTTGSLKSEQDVNIYVESIRAELMQYINNNEEIIIK